MTEVRAYVRLLNEALNAPVDMATDARLRRAYSTAYYMLFHRLCGAIADRFIGKAARGTRHYSQLYRSVDHKKSGGALKRAQQSPTASQDIKRFCEIFVRLQDLRASADYDPSFAPRRDELATLLIVAVMSLNAFNKRSDETDALFVDVICPKR